MPTDSEVMASKAISKPDPQVLQRNSLQLSSANCSRLDQLNELSREMIGTDTTSLLSERFSQRDLYCASTQFPSSLSSSVRQPSLLENVVSGLSPVNRTSMQLAQQGAMHPMGTLLTFPPALSNHAPTNILHSMQHTSSLLEQSALTERRLQMEAVRSARSIMDTNLLLQGAHEWVRLKSTDPANYDPSLAAAVQLWENHVYACLRSRSLTQTQLQVLHGIRFPGILRDPISGLFLVLPIVNNAMLEPKIPATTNRQVSALPTSKPEVSIAKPAATKKCKQAKPIAPLHKNKSAKVTTSTPSEKLCANTTLRRSQRRESKASKRQLHVEVSKSPAPAKQPRNKSTARTKAKLPNKNTKAKVPTKKPKAPIKKATPTRSARQRTQQRKVLRHSPVAKGAMRRRRTRALPGCSASEIWDRANKTLKKK